MSTRSSLTGLAVVAGLAVGLAACVHPGVHRDAPPALPAPVDGQQTYIEVNGAWLRVRDLPARAPREAQGRPILLVHGYGSWLESFAPVQERLSELSRVVAYDQRGFGFSERPPGAYGVAQHAADLLGVIDALALERPILVGHSYGAGVVLRLALDHPERVGGVVLADAFLFADQLPPAFTWARAPGIGELLFGAFYQQVPGEKFILVFHDRGRFVSLELLDKTERLMAEPGAINAALETVRGMDYADHEARYRSLVPPALVVWCRQDRVTPLAWGSRLVATLDDADFEVLEGCGHLPSLERPRRFARAIESFAWGLR